MIANAAAYQGIKVEGGRQLRKELKQAADGVKKLKKVNLSAAQIVAKAAIPLTPVGQSGKLVKSVKAMASQTVGRVKAGSKRVPYAGAVHWGRVQWPNLATKSTPSGRRPYPAFIQPSLFLTSAAAQTEPEWIKKYTQELDDLLDDIRGDRHTHI